MRLARLSLMILLSSAPALVAAEELKDVVGIQTAINAKQAEYLKASDQLEVLLQQQSKQQQQLELIRVQGRKLDAERKQALDAMNAAYSQVIENPTLDINEPRVRYQKAVTSVDQNSSDVAAMVASLRGTRNDIEQARIAKHTLLNILESLKEQLNRARVLRLQDEFTREASIDTEHTVNCQRTETIAACEERATQLAEKKASRLFLDHIFANLSEANLVLPKRSDAEASVEVLASKINSDGFSGKGEYSVNMSYNMRGHINQLSLCSLLNLDERYCVTFDKTVANKFVKAAPVSKPLGDVAVVADTAITPEQFDEQIDKQADKASHEAALISLTVRSNVHDDQVFIDGAAYGQSRVDVMLPAGTHIVEVRKAGFESFREKINLTKKKVVRAELKKLEQDININAKLRDVVEADQVGPEMLIVPAGNFKMGDITGNGLANEQPVRDETVANSYAISQNEITVAEFDAFVTSSGYVSEAEQGKGCAFYQNGQPVWEATLNWRNPSFEQDNNSPVVCVSYNDAKAYTDWLAKSANLNYRLPNEVEWEYAARAGSETDYFWGNAIGTNRANCGWCGSQWSNASTAPVASFPANKFGLHDTVGNVWEWTENQADSNDAVVRGGAWNFAPSLARASTRLSLPKDFRANYLGFRVVRDR